MQSLLGLINTGSKYLGTISSSSFEDAGAISDGLIMTQLPAAIAPETGINPNWMG